MNKPVPVNPPELRSTFVAASSMPWQQTDFDGIQMKILYRDDEGRSTILFKMAPGAVVPLHEHTALEQTYMLEGSLEDAEGSCGAGDFVWRPAATSTSPIPQTGRPSSPFSTGRTAFSTGRSFSRRTSGMGRGSRVAWAKATARPPFLRDKDGGQTSRCIAIPPAHPRRLWPNHHTSTELRWRGRV